MSTSRRRIATLAVSSIAALSLGLAGCSVGEIGGDTGATEGQTAITYLFGDSGGTGVPFAEAMTTKFNEMNPDIKVSSRPSRAAPRATTSSRPGSPPARWPDVFRYNSGSLFQALNPDQNLVPLDRRGLGRGPAGRVQDGGQHRRTASTARRSAPRWAAASSTTRRSTTSSGCRSRRPGPSSWPTTRRSRPPARSTPIADLRRHLDQPAVRARRLRQRGRAGCRTSPSDYTANKRKYADQPALQGFENQQDVFEAGYLNEDFASATFDDGVKAVATGKAAHYPMLTFAISAINAELPGQRRRRRLLRPPGPGRCGHPA